MPLTVHCSHQKPYGGSRTVTSAICLWHFVRFRPNFNYDKWPTLNCKTFELWPDHNGQKCDDPPNLASVFNTVNVLTFLCGRLIITQVLTTVPWSLAWSVPGSLNTTSGATRSTWPAGWRAPASWERYKYVRAWNFGRQRKEKLTSRLAQVSSQPKKIEWIVCAFDLQVTAETSDALHRLGYSCECRGFISVKGKGELETFFVCTDTSKQQGMGLSWDREVTLKKKKKNATLARTREASVCAPPPPAEQGVTVIQLRADGGAANTGNCV